MNKTFGNAFSKNKTFALSLTVLAVLVVAFLAGALAVRNTFIHSFGVSTLVQDALAYGDDGGEGEGEGEGGRRRRG